MTLTNSDKKPKIAFIMDPIEQVTAYKDTTVGMIFAAQKKAKVFYITLPNMWIEQGVAKARVQSLSLDNKLGTKNWYALGEEIEMELGDFDAILMRKDPPFDMEYIYASYVLDRAAEAGAYIGNNPQSLRDVNEKVFTAWFPELCPPTLITRDMQRMIRFQEQHGSVVAKPLDGMGGKSIFVVHPNDGNRQVVFETLTDNGTKFAMVQSYIPAITETGDQRVIIINGIAAPYALARIPSKGEHRGNLAAGGKGIGVPLSASALRIAEIVGPELKKRGVLFAGLDIIGDYMTEINVTSPTGIRELNTQFDLNLGDDYISAVLAQLN